MLKYSATTRILECRSSLAAEFGARIQNISRAASALLNRLRVDGTFTRVKLFLLS